MTIEILCISLLVGMTILAYMVAINSQGTTRLSISYLLATIILAGTVYVIVEYVNTSRESEKSAAMSRLEREKMYAEERARSQEQIAKLNQSQLKISQEQIAFAGQLTIIITRGTAVATTLANADLHDMSVELDELMNRAYLMSRKVKDFKDEFGRLSKDNGFFSECVTLIRESIPLLEESAQYYTLYFKSEDTAQEELRERLLKQKARAAYEKLQQASTFVVQISQSAPNQ